MLPQREDNRGDVDGCKEKNFILPVWGKQMTAWGGTGTFALTLQANEVHTDNWVENLL